MCGIAGIITRDALQSGHIEMLGRLNGLLYHRGPDGEGHYHDHHVALAMRRLSIIDLTTGWQPLYNEDRSLVLVANGEIYNFIELRQRLEASGHRFATGSDCETILHLYEEYGDQCVVHLRGMYAFALWDTKRRRLLIARDRMGEKPLYIASSDGELVFASELKALVRAGVVPFELDPHSVNLYYHYGYIPEPGTALRGVRKLPAAHLLSIDLDSWQFHERPYWRIEDAPPIETDPVTAIREELDRISDLIIRSDVPIGVALSGGLDSSIVATLAARKYPGTMQAFTVGYAGAPLQDERSQARELARHLNMPFHEIELSTADLVTQFQKVNYFRDDPIADIAGVGYYAVMQAAREQGVPVMLMGQGGDELFWGYRWVREALAATRRKWALRNGGKIGVFDYLKPTPPPFSYTLGLQWLGTLGGLRTGWQQYESDLTSAAGRAVFYESEHGFRDAEQKVHRGLYTRRFSEQMLEDDLTSGFVSSDPDSLPEVMLMRLICETYLMENGIAQGDRLSMAASVELRLPFVDYRFVETVVGLSKVHPGMASAHPKKWLREAVQGIVPDFVMARRKRGFSPPWRPWNKALSDAYGDQLLDGYLVQHGVITPEAARRERQRLNPNPMGLPALVAGKTLVLENWCRQMSES